ncbi:hypothetical protein K1X76_02385 [bacterium]|nr:hypothetical protein [bacterium]
MDGIEFKPGFSPKAVLANQKIKRSTDNSSLKLKGTDFLKSSLGRATGLPPQNLALDKSRVYSEQDKNKFVSENKDLLYVISQSDEATKLLGKKDISSRKDLSDIVAETAFNTLNSDAKKSITIEKLKSSSVLSSLISLNTGGIRDIVNEDENNAAILVSSATETANDLLDSVAQKTAALFEEDSPLNDAAFLKDHHEVAIYLYNNPDVVNTYNTHTNRTDLAEAFKNTVDHVASQEAFNSYIAQRADELVGSGSYDQSFFEDNQDLANLVVASSADTNIRSVARFLTDHPEYNLSNPSTADAFNSDQFLADVLADQTKNALGSASPITEDFLRSNPGFSRLALQKSDFFKGISSAASQKDLKIVFGNTGSQDVKDEVKKLGQSIASQFRSSYQDPRRAYSVLA